MKPLTEEEIVTFLSEIDPKFNNRKGVIVSKLKVGEKSEETRIAIWQMVRVEEGYITCKKGGISLKVAEFKELVSKIGEIQKKIAEIEQTEEDQFLSKVDNPEDFRRLKAKLEILEARFGDPCSSGETVSPPAVKKRKKCKQVESETEGEEDQEVTTGDTVCLTSEDSDDYHEEATSRKDLIRSFLDDKCKVAARKRRAKNC
jgi:hypothetical protein